MTEPTPEPTLPNPSEGMVTGRPRRLQAVRRNPIKYEYDRTDWMWRVGAFVLGFAVCRIIEAVLNGR